MSLNVFPVIRRELSVQSKRRGFYFYRSSLAGLGLLLALSMMALPMNYWGAKVVGQHLFNSLFGMAYLMCCTSCFLTCDEIGHEHREGTLGLLFLTPIRSVEVLLGKFGANGLVGMSGVVGLAPLLMLPVMLGGVTGGEAVRSAIVLLNTMFLALALGLWVSTSGRSLAVSARNALIAILAINLLPWLFEGVFFSSVMQRGCVYLLPSPMSSLFCSYDAAYQAHPLKFYSSILLTHLLGWLLIWRANHLLKANLNPQSGRFFASEVTSDSAVSAGKIRHIPKGSNPVAWLILQNRAYYLVAWGYAALSISQLIVCYYLRMGGIGGLFWIQGLYLGFNVLEVCLLAWLASSFIFKSRNTGEFELILTIPAGAKFIIAGQTTAIFRLLLWPVLFTIAHQILYSMLSMGGAPVGMRLEYVFSQILIGILSVISICSVALWIGATRTSRRSAIIWSLGSCFLMPELFSIVGYYIFARYFSRILDYVFYSIFDLAILAGYYIWLIRFSHRRFIASFGMSNLYADGIFKTAWEDFHRLRHWTPKVPGSTPHES